MTGSVRPSAGNTGGGPLIGELHVHHVPGFTAQSDIMRAVAMAARQA